MTSGGTKALPSRRKKERYTAELHEVKSGVNENAYSPCHDRHEADGAVNRIVHGGGGVEP